MKRQNIKSFPDSDKWAYPSNYFGKSKTNAKNNKNNKKGV